ncbi:MAG: hypothetical protein M3Q10_19400 [Chloroflexota bacterium]|nr:hypothetical protein [Chloroflexota bacterium]
MVIRLVAAIVARGGTLRVDNGRLVCRLPQGETLPADLAAAIAAEKGAIAVALGVAALEETVNNVLELDEDERRRYRALLAHDLVALAEAEVRLAHRERGGTPE